MGIKKTTGFKQEGLSGGWRTSAPHTQIEANQTPDLMNITIDSDGNPRKREGVVDMGKSLSIATGYISTVVPITCASGNHLLLVVSGGNATVYAYDTTTSSWVTTTTYNNIFSSTIQNKRLNHVVVQERDYTKVIFTSSRHVPIQFCITSGKGTVTKSNGTNTLWNGVLPVPPTVYQAGFADFTVWVNGEANTLSSFSSSAYPYGNATFQTSKSYANGTYTIQWACVSWQWWAEGMKLDKAQITNTEIQSVSTQHVPVPQDLLYDIDPYTVAKFPIFAYSSTAFDAKFTYTAPPTTVSQWAFSTGSGGTSGTTNYPASPEWVTFGAAPSSPRPVIFTRGYKLPFQGGRGLHTYNLGLVGRNNHIVFAYYSPVDWDRYYVVPPSEGGAGVGHTTRQAYYLRKADYTVSTLTTATYGEGIYITFDASSLAQGALSFTGGGDILLVVDTCSKVMFDNGWLGSGASGSGTYDFTTQTLSSGVGANYPCQFVNGRGYPHGVYGISDYCNYYLGYFPDVVATFQRRIVLGGMPHNPMQLVFSNVEDSHAMPGIFYNNFQTTIEYEYESTCAFDLTLPSYADDAIIAMREYADGLLVWTKYKLFRVFAADNDVVSVETVKYSTIAEIGCVNGMSALVAGNTPVFISSDGVYGVFPDNTASGYSVKELSVQIRDFFLNNNSNINEVGMLLYDSARKELFVVTACGHRLYGGELLVYNTVYEAWSRISWWGQKHSFVQSGCVMYRDLINPDVLFFTHWASGTGDFQLIKLHYTENVDVLYRTTYAGAPLTVAFQNSAVAWTTVNGQLNYNFPTYYAVDASRSKGLRLNPILSVEDCIVTLNGVRLTFGTQYIKTPFGIRLLSNPGAGVSLVAYPGWNYNGTVYPPIVCIQAGVMHYPNEFTVNVGASTITFNGSWTPTNTAIDVCQVYQSWLSSPGITLDTLKTKNAAHYLGYFDNRNTIVTNQKFNPNLAIVFDDTYSGVTNEELYGDYETLLAQSDMYGEQQYKPYARVMVPLLGSGYVLNAYHYVNSPCTFKLVGYELQVPQTNRQQFSDEEG